MRFSPVVLLMLVWDSLILFGGCASERGPAESAAARYKVEVLEHGIDPEIIPDRLTADFDDDGQLDRIALTDTSLHVVLISGTEFRYAVGEPPNDMAARINDAKLVSFDRSGQYPSIMLATEGSSPERTYEPILQQAVYNDSGHLTLKTLSDYPLVAKGLDCAWDASADLPVCFYAADGSRSWPAGPRLGQSRLIEYDPQGLRRLAMNADYLGFRNQVSQYDGSFQTAHLGARERVLAMRDVTPEAVDSIIASGWAQAAQTLADSVRTIIWGLSDRHTLYCRDLTREYRLPWPVELSYEYDQQRRPNGRWMDGYFMTGAAFIDFSGDGLLDLVAVGQHSGVFSAIKHEDGYFIDAGYRGLPDEYFEVSAPRPPLDAGLTLPPCVYYGMQRRGQPASRSDYLECYDRTREQWYEVTLPEGVYAMEHLPVTFWDINEDGMIDFAAMRDDGSWTSFTFVRE